MFEIELKNPDEISIRLRERMININVAQSTIEAGLAVGVIKGAGEFEIGEATVRGAVTAGGSVMYRIEIGGVTIGVVGGEVKLEDLDELGPIDILGTSVATAVRAVEPKIVILMGQMDFSELKASVKLEKKLKIKNASALPAVMEVYKLD